MRQPAPRRPADLRLVEAVRAEVRRLRREGRIPVELRLSQAAWNDLSPELRFAPFGGRRVMQFDGLPSALVLGLSDPQGFTVHTIAPRRD